MRSDDWNNNPGEVKATEPQVCVSLSAFTIGVLLFCAGIIWAMNVFLMEIVG